MAIVDNAMSWSGTLRRLALGNPDFVRWLDMHAQTQLNHHVIDSWFIELSGQPVSDGVLSLEQCRKVLRQLRQRVFFLAMVRDLAGLASLEEVTGAMTRLAQLAVQQSYQTAATELANRWGEPIDPTSNLPQELILIGMGKLGGGELNVSSDIDLIMLYGEEGETAGPRKISNHEFYVKLIRMMLPIISEFDGDGQVFRTDLRLRPDGDSGPLAWSLNAFEQYLFTQGREWERYAWLKADVIPARAFKNSNSLETVKNLESMRLPFVYRKYFDFDALAALRSLREQIRQDWERRATGRHGVDITSNIKLGDGGIREIEFVVQLTQLIRGGRMPVLQERNLLAAIAQQVSTGLLAPDIALQLELAYRFLRKTEHVLQYREDAQTHLLPQDPDLREALARAMGMSSQEFWATLDRHRHFVATLFKQAFRLAGLGESNEPTLPAGVSDDNSQKKESHRQFSQQLSAAITRFSEQRDELSARLSIFLEGHRIRALSAQNQQRVDSILMSTLAACAQTSQPLATIYKMLDFLETVAQRSSYLALLAEYPGALNRMARMMAASPWAAQYLLRHPVVLDSLISWQSMMEPIDFEKTRGTLKKDLDSCKLIDGQPDVEQQMNLMRDLQHQISFQLLAQDLEGLFSVEHLSDQLSSLADLLLQESITRVWPLVVNPGVNDTPIQPRLAVIAYGKLGGKEFGYSSDLDLVYLYDDQREHAQEQYAKLSRRLTSWISTLTSSGRMYEVDLRLRPDGEAGLLAVSVQAFENYEQEHAWVWEHQAITRARFCAGDLEVGAKFEDVRRKILMRRRDPADLRREILAMRDKITAGHPNRSDQFDIKHDSGGMVDLEFVTQYLVLLYASQYPALLENLGNIGLLNLAGDYGLIDTKLATIGANSYRSLRHRQHVLRLQGADKARVPQTELAFERKSIQALWQRVFETK